ncbi:hypothetical protein BJY54_003246 [Streptomyces nodosus]|nr:hypothetical protein [Streptomyces nodosus]
MRLGPFVLSAAPAGWRTVDGAGASVRARQDIHAGVRRPVRAMSGGPGQLVRASGRPGRVHTGALKDPVYGPRRRLGPPTPERGEAPAHARRRGLHPPSEDGGNGFGGFSRFPR